MELLAVLLVIAVVVSMTAPVFRAVRYEIKNSQAKNAAKKMAEAMHTYYQASRGHKITGSFTPTAAAGKNVIMTDSSNCSSPGATGIPAYKNGTDSADDVSQLFACGYLSYKDFASLPYEFLANDSDSFPSGWGTASSVTGKVYVLAGGVKADGSGDKYQKSKGVIYVDGSMTAKDTY